MQAFIAAYEAEMNLIIHTLHGGVLKVEVETYKITMEAYDDGPGIEDIDKAMQPGFSTASEEVRSKGFGAGMGLGLSIVDRIVRGFSGYIEVESVPGKGACFSVYIPHHRAEAATAGAQGEKA